MCVSTCVYLHVEARSRQWLFASIKELKYNVLELHTCSLPHKDRGSCLQSIIEKKFSQSPEAPDNHLLEPKNSNSTIKASNLLFLITLFQSFVPVFLLLNIT